MGLSKGKPNMFATTTGITGVLTRLGTGKTNGTSKSLECVMARVTKTGMPETAVGGGKERSGGTL